MRKRVIGAAGVAAGALAGLLMWGSGGEPSAGDTVQDWRTGEWHVNAGGYYLVLDLDEDRATHAGRSVRIRKQFSGDVVQVTVPGLRGGLLQLSHAEGRLVGTITANGEERQAAGQRPVISVVQAVEQGPCTFAQYSDGSWGVAPYRGDCHAALVDYTGGLRYAAREYTP